MFAGSKREGKHYFSNSTMASTYMTIKLKCVIGLETHGLKVLDLIFSVQQAKPCSGAAQVHPTTTFRASQ